MPLMPRGFVHQGELAAAVAKVQPLLAPDVIRIRHIIGTDWSGEPAIFFRIVLSDAASRRDRLRLVTTRVANTISKQIEPLQQFGLFPYLSFRTVSELTKLKELDWA
jgi:hypothetical protein